jgi:pyruvate,orthophosphate dikinase
MDLEIDLRRRFCRIGKQTMNEGDFLSIDGNDGGIYAGKLAVVSERPERELARIAALKTETSRAQTTKST